MRLTEIKARINILSPGDFQSLCDEFVIRNEKGKITCLGMEPGTGKTAKGTPDTYLKTDEGKYILVEYTTQKTNILKKVIDDLDKCVNVSGIPISRIEKM